jgi:tetratricopeptide (TPR) repeat protein
LQRFDASLDEAQKAVAADDNSIDGHRSLAYSLWYKGLFDGALENFEKAVAINPRLEFPYFELAAFAVGRNKYEMAIAAYDHVLSINSRSVKAFTRLCETYYRMGETPLAMDNCRNSITLDDEFTAAHKWLGQVYYTRRNYEGSIEEFEKCARQEQDQGVAPEDRFVECYYLRGLAWYYLDECDDAMPIFSELLTWTHDKNAIDKTNQGIAMCANKHPDQYVAPTPVPPTPTLPPPIQ